MIIEAMKQAVVYFEHMVRTLKLRDESEPAQLLFKLRQAIAEAEKQEPVAHFGSAYVNENGVHVTTVLGPVAIPQDAKLYTHPQPKREPL